MTNAIDARRRLRTSRLALPLATIATFAATVGLVALFWWLESIKAEGRSDDVRQVALGQQIYGQHCAGCHGKRLEGQQNWQVRKADGRLPAPPHDETGHTWHHPDRVLFEITRNGLTLFAPSGYQSDMSAFGGVLTDEEIWAVLTFIKSTWPESIREHQRRTTEASGKGPWRRVQSDRPTALTQWKSK